MLRLCLIRHGATRGNLERRYIGRTDEALCPEGRERLVAASRAGIYPPAERVYVTGSLRTRQTAEILYPERTPVVMDAFREKDFGRYEGKSPEELAGDPAYQRWLDSGGRLPFPEGEPQEAVRRRVLPAFDALLGNLRALYQGSAEDVWIAMILHGGTIMTILSERSLDRSVTVPSWTEQLRPGRSASRIPERPGPQPLHFCTRPAAGASRVTEQLHRSSFYAYHCGCGAAFLTHPERGGLVVDEKVGFQSPDLRSRQVLCEGPGDAPRGALECAKRYAPGAAVRSMTEPFGGRRAWDRGGGRG